MWESIGADQSTNRMQVPGGWIVQKFIGMNVASVFVEDQTHVWEGIFNWEKVSEVQTTYRMNVYGGWLVRTGFLDHSVAMTFVPDKLHVWDV